MFITNNYFSYGDKFILAQDDDDENNIELKMDDEIKCAPWNTTRAYVQVYNHNNSYPSKQCDHLKMTCHMKKKEVTVVTFCRNQIVCKSYSIYVWTFLYCFLYNQLQLSLFIFFALFLV